MPMVYLSELADQALARYRVSIAKQMGVVIDRSQAVLSLSNPGRLLDNKGNIIPNGTILARRNPEAEGVLEFSYDMGKTWCRKEEVKP